MRKNKNFNLKIFFLGFFFITLTFFLIFVLVKDTVPGYFQMKRYLLDRTNKIQISTKEITRIFSSGNTSLREMQNDLLNSSSIRVNKEGVNLIFLKAEEYANKNKLDLKFLVSLATAYNNYGKNTKDIEFMKKGESILRELIIFSPNRPDFNYNLALNLFFQQKYDESFFYTEKTFTLNNDYALQNVKMVKIIYENFVQYFYQVKNRENFMKAILRLKENNLSDQDFLNIIINYMNKNSSWPKIDFESVEN